MRIVFWTSHDFESNVQYLKTNYQRSSILSVAPHQAGAPKGALGNYRIYLRKNYRKYLR